MMNWIDQLAVYLVIGRKDCTIHPPIEVVKQALSAGVKTIQLREKKGNMREIIQFGQEIRKLTLEYHALFFVNDRLDLAQILEADGVHLGQDDIPIEEAKKLVPPTFKIGISAGSVKEAIEAEKQGADYIGVGSIYPTVTKEDAKWLGIDGLKMIRHSVALPIVAIGGIQKENIPECKENGANSIAVVSAITRSNNPYQSAKELVERWGAKL
ncbi:thiamine-phosphate synthase [Tepidibacillus sp. HK-1]|nr:thiamine-phosphate synthase [Tepidibacillus sp. HK-1]